MLCEDRDFLSHYLQYPWCLIQPGTQQAFISLWNEWLMLPAWASRKLMQGAFELYDI
jgi:hypothetical protein